MFLSALVQTLFKMVVLAAVAFGGIMLGKNYAITKTQKINRTRKSGGDKSETVRRKRIKKNVP